MRDHTFMLWQSRIDEPKLIEAAKSKLLIMDEKQTRLLSGLSERVVADGASITSSIALLLIATLIILL